MISVAEMRAVEERARASGIGDSAMMEKAGLNAAKILNRKVGLDGRGVLVFCGTGNNAGDGLVFARYAAMLGAYVAVYFVKGAEVLKQLARLNYVTLKHMGGGQMVKFLSRAEGVSGVDILVDAMLGIGIKGEVSVEFAEAIGVFNSMNGLKVALDCPSGIDADTGKVLGVAVKPDITITFYDTKPGLNEKNSGEIIVAGIGVPKF